MYSVLTPDTISDSPSAKSKGVRLDSAKIQVIHKKYIGIIIKKNIILVCDFLISKILTILNI